MSCTNSLNALFFLSNLLYSTWAVSKFELYMEYNWKDHVTRVLSESFIVYLKVGASLDKDICDSGCAIPVQMKITFDMHSVPVLHTNSPFSVPVLVVGQSSLRKSLQCSTQYPS